ncbi:glycoside hydrolase family 61 protein [Ceratobasidium sp. AG-Ba]|nr:glycoside hydrolase family 61 protein [Ceratobasidium sp. AG-Ba]
MFFNAVIALAPAVASVSAHGFVSSVTVGDHHHLPHYECYGWKHELRDSAAKAALVADANQDKVTLNWKSGQNKNWGHSLGPIMTYLAQVPAGQTADKFDTKNAKLGSRTDGAQFYPSCVQLRVSGGSSAPKAVAGAQTVSFPGGYTPNDKSLFVPDLFKKTFTYSFPGPALFKSTGTAAISSSNSGSTGNSTTGEPKSCKSKVRRRRSAGTPPYDQDS